MTPFQALYGYKPSQLTLSPTQTLAAAVKDWTRERVDWNTLLKENLLQAQNRMKQLADKRRTDRNFEEGDWVYLKLQPYRQTSVAFRRSLKLSARYYGPYQVEQKVGSVAYRLKLPDVQCTPCSTFLSLRSLPMGAKSILHPPKQLWRESSSSSQGHSRQKSHLQEGSRS
nr:uncharacterized protein LOC113696351 [Coffea arabica]